MHTAQTESTDGVAAYSPIDALAYEAPFLIDKLIKDRIVDTHEEGEALFTEVKRFCVLVESDNKIWDMYSLRVDEVWHQFILFTREYMDFCKRFFGRYIPHSPSNAPRSDLINAVKPASFDEFTRRYHELFGEPLTDLWYDERSVTPRRRVLNDLAGTLTLRNEHGMVDLLTPAGDVLLSVNEFARDALTFIFQTGAFYVRELPGGLDDEEKVALVATLVQYKLLRVGA
jgi:hypothetical protein